jgi:hypothetical protein
MALTAEIRWFWENAEPAGWREWLCGTRSIEPEIRTDKYYYDRRASERGEANLGFKYRGGANWEIKALVATLSKPLREDPFVGEIELWTKWPASMLQPSNGAMVTEIIKTRWLRKYDTANADAQEVSKDEHPPTGCTIELTKVELCSGTFWWTLCLEAYGEIDTVEGCLRQVSRMLAEEQPPKIYNARLDSYPSWLNEQLRAQPTTAL